MSEPLTLTKAQARRFVLLWQGLLGRRRFSGEAGILAYIRQAGAIQFDPVDICGKNADLVLQARVAGYRPEQLERLLYEQRQLVDHYDKCLCILPVEQWPAMRRMRDRFARHAFGQRELAQHGERIVREIAQRGPLRSADLALPKGELTQWGRPVGLSRALLEKLTHSGRLLVAQRRGLGKTYDLAERVLPQALTQAEDPNPTQEMYDDYQVARRVGAVGLLWMRPSDAWLFVQANRGGREAAARRLAARGVLAEVRVEGIPEPLYAPNDPALFERALRPSRAERMEFLAPLDGFLWDRNLIERLFGFYYRWEVYTPKAQRVYGHYVLPILSGERLIGRIQPVREPSGGPLCVKGLWLEAGVRATPALMAALDDRLAAFAAFAGCGFHRWDAAPVERQPEPDQTSE